MVDLSGGKALAALLTALILCLLAAGAYFFANDAVRGAAAWAKRRIALAVSPRGGLHFLLEVDTAFVGKDLAEQLRDDVRRVLREARAGFAGLAVRGQAVEVRIRDESDYQAALATLRQLEVPPTSSDPKPVDITEAGDRVVRLAITDAAMTARVRQVTERSKQVIERRLSEFGTTVRAIERQGDSRIAIDVAGTADRERLVALLSKTAKLAFRLVDVSIAPDEALQGKMPPDSEVLYSPQEQGRQPYLVEKRALITGEFLTDAQPAFDQRTNEPVVTFRFSDNGARRFAQITSENVGRPFAIVLDNEVFAAPIIREPILGGSGQISGGFTVQSANDLALMLRVGAMPAPIRLIEQRAIDAGLRRAPTWSDMRIASAGGIAR